MKKEEEGIWIDAFKIGSAFLNIILWLCFKNYFNNIWSKIELEIQSQSNGRFVSGDAGLQHCAIFIPVACSKYSLLQLSLLGFAIEANC